MKVLVTGGLGYIGGRLVEHLRQQTEYTLRLLVRRVPAELSTWIDGLEIWPGDLTQPETLRGIGDDVDAVIHLAALNEVECVREPVAALRVNVEGTLHLLEALNPDLRQFIYLSTFHVYGANGHGMVTEKTPLAAVHPYAATHAMAELYVSMYARQRRHGATIVRLSNAYGAPLYSGVNRWTLVVNDLCRQAIERRRLVLRSSGLQVRDFIALSDVVRAIELLLTNRDRDVRICNLGGMATHSILDVAQTVQKIYAELYGQALPLERPQPPPGKSRGSLHFECKSMQTLGFMPQVSLEEGVREMLQFCHHHFQLDADTLISQFCG